MLATFLQLLAQAPAEEVHKSAADEGRDIVLHGGHAPDQDEHHHRYGDESGRAQEVPGVGLRQEDDAGHADDERRYAALGQGAQDARGRSPAELVGLRGPRTSSQERRKTRLQRGTVPAVC